MTDGPDSRDAFTSKNSQFYQFLYMLSSGIIQELIYIWCGEVSENPFQNDSAALARASARTSLRPIAHLVKITKKMLFCYEQTYQHLLIVAR